MIDEMESQGIILTAPELTAERIKHYALYFDQIHYADVNAKSNVIGNGLIESHPTLAQEKILTTSFSSSFGGVSEIDWAKAHQLEDGSKVIGGPYQAGLLSYESDSDEELFLSGQLTTLQSRAKMQPDINWELSGYNPNIASPLVPASSCRVLTVNLIDVVPSFSASEEDSVILERKHSHQDELLAFRSAMSEFANQGGTAEEFQTKIQRVLDASEDLSKADQSEGLFTRRISISTKINLGTWTSAKDGYSLGSSVAGITGGLIGGVVGALANQVNWETEKGAVPEHIALNTEFAYVIGARNQFETPDN